jgi:UDP-glucose 4-epimerase
MTKKILITGVAGHLGSAFAQWVIDHIVDVKVVGLDNLSSGFVENIADDPRLVWTGAVDLSEGALPWTEHAEFDYVFHFAAYAAEGLSPFIRRFDTTNNLVSTLNVINGCINMKVKRLVFASSMAVYGRGLQPFTEGDPRRPIDPYGITKAACEMQIESAHDYHGLDYCILRPHNVYGPGQNCWQAFRNVLGHWMTRSVEGKTIQVYGDGTQVRAFSYIDDILEPIWWAAEGPEAKNQIINLGGWQEVELGQAAAMVSELTGAPIEFVEPRKEAHKAVCTTTKSQQVLGYRQKVFLNEGLERMWKWFLEAWEKYPSRRGRHKVAPLETEQGLYSFWKPYC